LFPGSSPWANLPGKYIKNNYAFVYLIIEIFEIFSTYLDALSDSFFKMVNDYRQRYTASNDEKGKNR
jgi:hypothetical protein